MAGGGRAGRRSRASSRSARSAVGPDRVRDADTESEVVDDGVTGLIVPPCDSDALANAIVKILKDDRLRKQMGDNAYMKMKKELAWDKIAEKTIEVYESIMGNNR